MQNNSKVHINEKQNQNTPAGRHDREDRAANRQTQVKMEEPGTKAE